MKIKNRHERVVAAPPERIAALIADFDRVWPTQIAPAPRRHEHRLYDAGPMLWEEFDRPGAARAFRVVRPDELQASRAGRSQTDGGIDDPPASSTESSRANLGGRDRPVCVTPTTGRSSWPRGRADIRQE